MSIAQANAGERDPGPSATFVIPTFNRVDTLRLCLQHLERQSVAGLEVILIDDGSTDSTPQWVDHYLLTTPLRLRFVRQANAGPARARNVGVSLATTPICLIIGDDILCLPTFAETHIRFHQQHPELNQAAVGLTRWSESEQTVTPFMRWMDSSGTQFAYGALLGGQTPDWRHFYTSNLSLKTDLLRQHPFNESFCTYGIEDMELGYRLEQRVGLQLRFLPDAIAEHVHPTDFSRACSRASEAAKSLQVFDTLWPLRPKVRHGRGFYVARDFLVANAWMLRPITAFTALMTRLRCPNPLIRFTLMYHTAVARHRKP